MRIHLLGGLGRVSQRPDCEAALLSDAVHRVDLAEMAQLQPCRSVFCREHGVTWHEMKFSFTKSPCNSYSWTIRGVDMAGKTFSMAIRCVWHKTFIGAEQIAG